MISVFMKHRETLAIILLACASMWIVYKFTSMQVKLVTAEKDVISLQSVNQRLVADLSIANRNVTTLSNGLDQQNMMMRELSDSVQGMNTMVEEMNNSLDSKIDNVTVDLRELLKKDLSELSCTQAMDILRGYKDGKI